MKHLKLSIITQQKIVYEDEVQEVIAPTAAGVVGILPEHAPLLARIVPGELIVKKGSRTEPMAISGGFLEISDNKLTILADSAVHAKDIDIKKAEDAKARAEKLMHEKLDEFEYADLEKEFARAIAELNVARKYTPK